MNSRLNRVLEEIRINLDECGIASVDQMAYNTMSHASSTKTIQGTFFDFMDELVDDLRLVYGMKEEAAFDFAADIGDFMAEKGLLPPFPSDGMNDAEIARWVNAASYSDFKRRVMSKAGMKE